MPIGQQAKAGSLHERADNYLACHRARPPESWLGPAGCAGASKLTALSGTLSDGSGNYANSATCSWLIEPTSAILSVTLSFAYFQTESGYDELKVYDGDSAEAPEIASLSGSDLPSPIAATSGKMFVIFTSDSSDAEKGFSAAYTATTGTALHAII